jgi:exodeoxyribonuclease VII small subunit
MIPKKSTLLPGAMTVNRGYYGRRVTPTLPISFRGGSLAPQTTRNMPVTDASKINLEKSLAELEKLVDELETGDLPLEQAMKKFEEGIKLTRDCQAALQEAEQKVEILLKSAAGEELEDFEAVED